MELLLKYFPDLERQQKVRFEKLLEIIPSLNEKVNIISRKDISSLEEKHVLHSLSIARKFNFNSKTHVVDVGTGGGFPGIPLAILFPQTKFTLVDSIGKKIRLVAEVTETLNLKNVTPLCARMEEADLKADFVVSRAVTAFPRLYQWTKKFIRHGKQANLPNGLISLKGGDLDEELDTFRKRVELFPISAWFEEPFFSTKKIVYLKK
jgi:16S rRNA (guanine527-N7)-methyltransferase